MSGRYEDAWGVLRGEFIEVLRRADLAFHLAWSDTRTRYRRSVLGPFWLVLGTAIGVGGLGIVWSTLFEIDRATFIPSLTIGLVTWYLLSSCVVEAASVFYSNRDLLLNMPISSLLVSVLLLFRQSINFVHNFVVVIVVLIIYPQHLTPTAFLIVPGYLLVSLNLLWVIQLVGYLGARYRDLAPLLSAIVQPLFFLTPVLFRPEQLGTKAFIAELNPFTYWMALIRDPLMGMPPAASTWIAAFFMAVVGWGAALILTVTKRHRLAYWVH